MSNLSEYKSLLMESLYARVGGDSFGEDRILDMLDRIWLKMSVEERDAANEYTSEIAREYLDETGKVIKPLPEIVEVP